MSGSQASPLARDGALVMADGAQLDAVALLQLLLSAPLDRVLLPPAERAAVERLRAHIRTVEAAETLKASPRPLAAILADMAEPLAAALKSGADASARLNVELDRLAAPSWTVRTQAP